MARMTIAQMRKKELDRLVSYKTDDPKEEDYAEARRLMNSFYRLCGLCETNLYLANNERTCDSTYTKESEEREMKWSKRLSDEFQKIYGLQLFYAGYYPSIGIKYKDTGACSEKISTFFYN